MRGNGANRSTPCSRLWQGKRPGAGEHNGDCVLIAAAAPPPRHQARARAPTSEGSTCSLFRLHTCSWAKSGRTNSTRTRINSTLVVQRLQCGGGRVGLRRRFKAPISSEARVRIPSSANWYFATLNLLNMRAIQNVGNVRERPGFDTWKMYL